jgi:hypothetical protein
MKKSQKFSTLLLASFMVIAFMLVPGNTASAHEENCGCMEVVNVYGSERNIVVADMLKSDIYKEKKKELEAAGYQVHGVADFQVQKNVSLDAYLVAIPLLNVNGEVANYLLYAMDRFQLAFPAAE